MFTMFIGHKYLYERGVLHRDISPGNILIKWRPSSETDHNTSGCLIDLDHAKRGKLSEHVTTGSVDDDLDDLVQLWCSTRRVDIDVARWASRFFSAKNDDDALPLLTYVKAALAHSSKFRPPNAQIFTPKHLGWKPVWALFFRFLALTIPTSPKCY